MLINCFCYYFCNSVLYILCCAAAGCILLGTVIFGANDAEEDHLSWAFALCIVGGIFFGVAGVLIIVASVVLKR